jgi:hypothetical protein
MARTTSCMNSYDAVAVYVYRCVLSIWAINNQPGVPARLHRHSTTGSTMSFRKQLPMNFDSFGRASIKWNPLGFPRMTTIGLCIEELQVASQRLFHQVAAKLIYGLYYGRATNYPGLWHQAKLSAFVSRACTMKIKRTRHALSSETLTEGVARSEGTVVRTRAIP